MSDTTSRRLLVLYGSQEGCAESVAQRVASDASTRHGWDVELAQANKYKKYLTLGPPKGAQASHTSGAAAATPHQFVVVVCSTTGNGDPPDNCDRFWRYLKRRTHPGDLLQHVDFAVLGLGDSNYDKFCYMGKGIDKKMSALGAHRIHTLGCADDGVGLSIVIEPWVTGFFPALEVAYKRALENEARYLPERSQTGADKANEEKATDLDDAKRTSAVTATATATESSTPASSKRVLLSPSSDSGALASMGVAATRDFVLPLPISSKVRPDDSGQRRRTHLVSDGENRLIVLYGRKGDAYPEKGVAEALAAAAAERYGWTAKALPCGKYRRTGVDGGFIHERTVLAVLPVLSPGGGNQDATVLPDDCQRFLRYVGRSSHASDFLSNMKYGVISVSVTTTDSNREDDGENIALELDARLSQIGASRFAPLDCMVRSAGTSDPWCRVWAESYWRKFDSDAVLETSMQKKRRGGTETPPAIDISTPTNAIQQKTLEVDQKHDTSGRPTTTAATGSKENTTRSAVSPALPQRLRALVDCGGMVGFRGQVPENIIRRAQIAPLPRALAPGFRCVFSSRATQQASSPGIRGRIQSSAASSGQSGPDSPQLLSKRQNMYTRRRPFLAQILNASYLTAGGASAPRRVIHMELGLLPERDENPFTKKNMIQYIPGDAIGVVVPNEATLVEWMLCRLGLTDVADEVFTFESNAAKQRDIALGVLPSRHSKAASNISHAHRTPRLALTHALDLTAPPRRGLLRALADCCEDSIDVSNSSVGTLPAQAELEKSKLLLLSSRDGRELHDRIITKMCCGLPEILAMFPTCKPPLSVILSGVVPLMPRYYSVSSSPLKDPTKLSIAFTVVEYTTKPPSGGGAATKKGKKLAQVESTAVRVTNIGGYIGANASADIGAGVCRKSGSKSNESGIGGSAVAMRPILRKGLCTSWLERLATPMLLASEQEAGKPGESKMDLTVGHRGNRSSTCSSFGQSETSNSDVDIDGDSAVVPTMRIEADPRTATPTPPLPIRIPLYIRETKEFALPANHKYPIIMIGPGTGVAPFIGFLEHRQQQCAQQSDHKDDVCSGLWRGGFELDGLQDDDEYSGQRINNVYGECVLFFGNRNRAKDFLYESRLNEFLQDGTLTQLHVAFSRDTQKKVYVQHKMLEQAASIYRMLVKENGYIYVCGDGAKMAKDVDRALMMILSTQGGKVRQGVGGAEAAEMAKTLVEKLKKQGRYVKDVWS